MSNELDYSLLKEVIADIVTDIIMEKRKRRKKKPGGGLTALGAQRHLNKGEYESRVKSILTREKGDIESAADALGVSKRTLYQHLNDDSKLDRAADEAQKLANMNNRLNRAVWFTSKDNR
jgi:hypothetical protein